MIYALVALGGVVVGLIGGVFLVAAALAASVARLELQVDYLHTLTHNTPWSARMRAAPPKEPSR